MKHKISRNILWYALGFMLALGAPAFASDAADTGEAIIRETGQTYDTLEEALIEATSNQTVVLTSDASLEGNAQVKRGVTLVLPADGKGYEGAYNPSNPQTVSNPQLEYTLTIPSGASLKIDGTLLVNGVTGIASESSNTGADVSGAYSQIHLDGSVTVNDGGLLDVYGYVTGNGTVTANAGGTVRDLMVVKGWRGISYAQTAYFWNIFPFNEYDMNHIQTKTILYSGATLGGNVRLYAEGRYYSTVFLAVDSQNGIFRLSEGARLEKVYENGREVWRFYGGASFSSASYEIQDYTLNTASCFYAIDGDQDFELLNGTYRMQNAFKWMPGGTLTVGKDAALSVEKGGKLAIYDASFQDAYTGATAYPASRGSASLKVQGALNVSGQIGGSVQAEGGSRVTLESGAQKYATVKEGSSESAMGKDFTFYLNMTGAYQCRFPDAVSLSREAATIGIGETLSLSVSMMPGNVTERGVTYTSSNQSAATVDGSGNVKGVGAGNAVITVRTSNGKTASCSVTVVQKAPATVKTSVLSSYRVRIEWTKAPGASRYTIYRASAKNGVYKKIGSTSKRSFVDKKTKFGKRYYYKVAAGNAYSKSVSVKVKPLAPKKLKKSPVKEKVQLKWKKNGKVTGYQVYRSVSAKGKYKKIGETTKTTFTDKSAKKNKKYYYKVRAYRKVGKKRVYGEFTKICAAKRKK